MAEDNWSIMQLTIQSANSKSKQSNQIAIKWIWKDKDSDSGLLANF